MTTKHEQHRHDHSGPDQPKLHQTAAAPEATPAVEPVAGAVIPETAGSEGAAEPTMAERIVQLEEELTQAQQSIDESSQRMLRIQADFDNFRKRSRQEFEQACLCAGEDLVKKVLPVLDSMERAVACFTTTGDNKESCGWQEGLELTLKQLQQILSAEGLEQIAALDQPFNPQVHQAVAQEESTAVSEAMVLAELQKGYSFKGKLLRPALVKVAVPQDQATVTE